MKLLSYKRIGLLTVCVCLIGSIYAQDTTKVTLPQAEQIFLDKNLSLLAEKYNIDIAKAQVIQAKIYPNPNLVYTGTVYNPEKNKFLDIGNKTGEYTLGVQQLILLAGKRNKQIKMAETGVAMSENEFSELLRSLQFTLRTDFYSAHFLYNSINAYQQQIESVERLNSVFEQLLQKGTVTLKDAVRIKSLLYSLQSEKTLLQNQFNDVQAELQQLLQDNKTVYLPIADDNISLKINPINFPLQTLLDTAYNYRSDLKLANNSVLFNRQNYTYQKALATPDLTVGASYDRRASYVEKVTMFSVAMDLPFFNKNQGNIKAAKISIDQTKVLAEKQKQQVESEVQHAYLNALNTYKMLKGMDPSFQSQFAELLHNVTINFEKRNINLLDFTDFIDSYKQNILQLNQLQNQQMQAVENLNYACGKIVLY
ncbi:MAG: TolC family protein [Bacteroidetes bacterium]|nr:TolC family protein [Bacteroidota bacterium]